TNSELGRFCVDCRHCRDWLPAIAYATASQRVFIHCDWENTVGVRAIIARNDRDDSIKCTCLRDVQLENFTVTYWTSEDASDQGIVVIEVSSISGTPGDFINSINQRSATAGRFLIEVEVGSHKAAPAASLTDSMIFTYPVHRQRFPDKAVRISLSVGVGLRRRSASAAIIIPGVQKPHCVPSFL